MGSAPKLLTTIDRLEPADIVVSTTDHPQSRAIRIATGGTVSHAMVFLGGPTRIVAEAVGEGTRCVPIDVALSGSTLAIALRHRDMTPEAETAVVIHAQHFGDAKLPYDHVGAIGAGMNTANTAVACTVSRIGCDLLRAGVAINASTHQRDLRFFCSELVARSFLLAGMPLVDEDASFSSPREIRESKVLKYLGHLRG